MLPEVIDLNTRRPVVIGIAGGIAAGKSVCAKLLAGADGAVIDADQIVKNLQDEPAVVKRMEETLGAPLRNSSGGLDRAAAAAIAFGDSAKRKALESWLHPMARERIEASLQSLLKNGAASGHPRGESEHPRGDSRHPRGEPGQDREYPGGAQPPIVVLDVPLLFEGGLYKRCDGVVFIESPESSRVERTQQARGWGADELARREAHQWSLEEKRRRARWILQNSGNLDDLRQEASRVRAGILSYWKNAGENPT